MVEVYLASDEKYVGEGITAANAGWSFGGHAADVFAQHVRRSIPMYESGHELVCQLSDFFVKSDSVVYEIGTSLGELLVRLVKRHQRHSGCMWVGIDIEPDMVDRARESLREEYNVSVEVADIVRYDLQKSDLIVSYYCLQFVPPKYRQDVLNQIYEALHWGGAFIWFEKVRACDARFQDITSLLYVDYKLEQNYSPEEIVGKSRSLKGVLEPFSSEGNRDLLKRAGFVDILTVFKYLCFEGILVIK